MSRRVLALAVIGMLVALAWYSFSDRPDGGNVRSASTRPQPADAGATELVYVPVQVSGIASVDQAAPPGPTPTEAVVRDEGRLHALDSEWNVYLPNIDLAQPEREVRALLEEADAGNPSAYRHLARLTEFCRRGDNEAYDEVEARRRFDAQYASEEISAELHALFIEMNGFCGTVTRSLPTRDWYSLGRQAGDPVLLLMDRPEATQVIRFGGESTTDAATRAAVIAEADSLDPILLRTIRGWSVDVDGVSDEERILRIRAWDHLICRVDSACDEPLALAILTRDVFAYEREAVLAEVDALEALVRTGRLTPENLHTSARGQR